MSCPITKPTKWPVCPAKTQISLGIRRIWSKSSLYAWRNIWHLHVTTYLAHQTKQMQRLTWVFTGRTSFCWFCGAAAQMCCLMRKWDLSILQFVIFQTHMYSHSIGPIVGTALNLKLPILYEWTATAPVKLHRLTSAFTFFLPKLCLISVRTW